MRAHVDPETGEIVVELSPDNVRELWDATQFLHTTNTSKTHFTLYKIQGEIAPRMSVTVNTDHNSYNARNVNA